MKTDAWERKQVLLKVVVEGDFCENDEKPLQALFEVFEFFVMSNMPNLTVFWFQYIAYLPHKFTNSHLGIWGSQIALKLIRIGRKKNNQKRKRGKSMHRHPRLQRPAALVPSTRCCHSPKTAWWLPHIREVLVSTSKWEWEKDRLGGFDC